LIDDDFPSVLPPPPTRRRENSYAVDLAQAFLVEVFGWFLDGWTLMLALGILDVHLGYWPAVAVAWLLNSTLGRPTSAVKMLSLRLKHGRL